MAHILGKATTLAMSRRMASTAAAGHSHEAGQKLWKNFSIFMAVPCVVVMSVYNFLHMAQQAEHGHERPDFVAYDHMRLRTKRFPWGEGQKSLFHNPHVNPLPTGYEEH